MTQDVFAELHGATCLHCGHRTTADVCPRCQHDTVVGPPVTVGPQTVRIGWIGRGGAAAAALWLSSDAGDVLVTTDGRKVDTTPTAPTGFVAVEGLTSLRSDVAAALVACRSEALLGWGGSAIEPTLITHRFGVDPAIDLPAARRAACELAIAGCPEAVALLPLSPGEVSWWTALGHLRLGDRDAAVRTMGELPLDGYAVITVVLRWASQRWVGDAASAARFLLGKRVHGSATQRLAQVSVACGITPLARFLLEPDKELPEQLRHVGGASPSVARALALRGAQLAEPLDVGPNVSLSVLDDLIDLGTPLDPATLSDEQRRHVVARTRPEALSDDDVDQLGLGAERDRRRLAAGRFDEIDAALAGPHVRGIVHLVESGSVDDDLRSVDPVRAEHLATFLESPTAAHLTDELVADTSLWPLLAARLDVPLWTWGTDLDHATQRFVGWYALRATFDHLVVGAWEAALETGHHAHRLAADDHQRRDALNLIAFAHWQRGDGEAARDTLLSAIGGTDDVPLRVNLAIVASSLDPESAALELARLVRESSSPELRCAAAMRAVHLWSTDDLPWTVRRHRPVPPALIDALRELVVEPVDPGVLRAILGLQSNLDRDWLARPAHLAASPHRQSLELKVFQARATGPREFVDALTFVLRSASPPEWVFAERDRTVETAARHVFDDDGSSALFALFAVQRKMPVTPEQQALLAPLAVLAVSAQTERGDDPPPDSYLTLLAEADTHWLETRPTAHVRTVMDVAWERLATCHVRFLEIVIDKMVRAVEDLDRRLRRDPRLRKNAALLRTQLEPILDDAIAADDVLSEFRPHVTGAPIAREIDDLLRIVRDIRRASMRML
ncbi:MAG: hypothetical protein F2534_04935 [Actinobacteria bacterium]|uniref:Unannotated protein n=1 Tax=freshwater metagenome TaxID=449393 RepID=A0A6J6CCK6_9ZZZZ|nr:hypothetical protein [Actinomycetota bacterium]